MVTTVKLDAQLRSETGKSAARSLRRAGFIPAVVYGHGEETRACKVDSTELERLLTSVQWENTIIELNLDDGKSSSVLIREVQIHPYRREVLHIDFLAVHKGEKVKLEVPVRLVGVAPGVKEGGIMEHHRTDVEIRCIPSKIPEALEFDISSMGIGDVASVGGLEIPDGVEILSDPTVTLASIVHPAVHKVEVEVEEEVEVVEEPAEPEVIGRGKPAEERGEAEEG